MRWCMCYHTSVVHNKRNICVGVTDYSSVSLINVTVSLAHHSLTHRCVLVHQGERLPVGLGLYTLLLAAFSCF